MEFLGYPDGAFDAVVCIFAIFFVQDMARQVRELWRLIRPGGALAITTWGPRMFEPGSSIWRAVVRDLSPDLYSEFNPWDRINEPNALRALLAEANIADPEIAAEAGRQTLHKPEDWGTGRSCWVLATAG
jgi:SAM-dependent methyltransferase